MRASDDAVDVRLRMRLEALDAGRDDQRVGSAWRTGVVGVCGEEEEGGEPPGGEPKEIGDDSMGIALGVTGLGAWSGGDHRTLGRRG